MAIGFERLRMGAKCAREFAVTGLALAKLNSEQLKAEVAESKFDAAEL